MSHQKHLWHQASIKYDKCVMCMLKKHVLVKVFLTTQPCGSLDKDSDLDYIKKSLAIVIKAKPSKALDIWIRYISVWQSIYCCFIVRLNQVGAIKIKNMTFALIIHLINCWLTQINNVFIQAEANQWSVTVILVLEWTFSVEYDSYTSSRIFFSVDNDSYTSYVPFLSTNNSHISLECTFSVGAKLPQKRIMSTQPLTRLFLDGLLVSCLHNWL